VIENKRVMDEVARMVAASKRGATQNIVSEPFVRDR